MKLEGSVNGEDMQVLDAPEDFKPTMADFQASAPGVVPQPTTTVVMDPPATTATGTATVTQVQEPPAATATGTAPVLPDGQYGTFRDVDTMYKSWREASKKISQDGEEKRQLALALEQERLARQQLEQRLQAPASVTPAMSKEQIIEQFVNDPHLYEQNLEQRFAQKYLTPVVSALQQMYKEQQELREKESIPQSDRTLYTQFQQDGVFDAMRQNPRYARFTNADLLELGKAQMIQHQVNALQAQIDKTRQAQASKNSRAVVESGSSTTAPAKTLEQMDEKELKSLAQAGWQTGERF